MPSSINEEIDPQTRRNRKIMVNLFLKLNNYSHWNADHSMAVAKIARDFGKTIGLNASEVVKSALTHDIGKVEVDKRILHKPKKLSAEEFPKMALHAAKSEEYLNKLSGQEGQFARLGARFHHTRPSDIDHYVSDGSMTEKEALLIKVITIADIFEALTSQSRPYKEPTTKYDALQLMATLDIVDKKVFEKFSKWQLSEFANEYRQEYTDKKRIELKSKYEADKEAYDKKYDHYIATSKAHYSKD